jgi:hypothetical protein
MKDGNKTKTRALMDSRPAVGWWEPPKVFHFNNPTARLTKDQRRHCQIMRDQLIVPGHLGPMIVSFESSSSTWPRDSKTGDPLDEAMENLIQEFRRLRL